VVSSWVVGEPLLMQLETCASGKNQKLVFHHKVREAPSHAIVELLASSDSQWVTNQEQGISSCYYEIEYLALVACYDCGCVLVVAGLDWGSHRRTDVSKASCDTVAVID
jgi:hypothetical protein